MKTKGWAVTREDGDIDPNTVAKTWRGAMVNWILTHHRTAMGVSTTDLQIVQLFLQLTQDGKHKLVAVEIYPSRRYDEAAIRDLFENEPIMEETLP